MTDKPHGVMVGYCDSGTTAGIFTQTLTDAVAYATAAGMMRRQIRVQSGPRIATARNAIVSSFLSYDAEWLLMVDTDMALPHDIIPRLVEAADPETAPIVGGLCFGTAVSGSVPTLMYLDERGVYHNRVEYPPDELVRVDATGAACLLMHRTALHAMAVKYGADPFPWFVEGIVNGRPVGEDIAFCAKASQLGIPIHVHTGVEVGHEKTMIWDATTHRQHLEASRMVVTGTGRCGTGYMARVLNSLGLYAGHEQVYGPTGVGEWGNRIVDVSWLAAPFLDDHPGRVLHLVRHPVRVVNSLMGIGFFDDDHPHGEYRKFAEDWCPEAFEYGPAIDKAVQFVLSWNERVEYDSTARIRVEEISHDPNTLHEILAVFRFHPIQSDVAYAVGAVPTDVNSRPRGDVHDWDDLPDMKITKRLRDQADRYGYG